MRPEQNEVDPLEDLQRPGGGTTSAVMRTRDARVGKFLDAFSQCGSIRKACEVSGISRRSIHRWRESDAEFKDAFDEAAEEFADRVREAIKERAMDGWDEPVFGKDGQVGVRRKFSDSLLERLAESKCPEFKRAVQLEASADVMETARRLRAASETIRSSVPPPPTEPPKDAAAGEGRARAPEGPARGGGRTK